METDNGPTEVPGIGDQLSRAREAMGRSREAMAQELRLTVDQITYLETEAFHCMPGEAYVRGFLRNYAAALGLDPEQVLHTYERSSGDQQAEAGIDEEAPLIPEPERPLLEHPWRVAVISLLLVGVVSAVTIYFIERQPPSLAGSVAEDASRTGPQAQSEEGPPGEPAPSEAGKTGDGGASVAKGPGQGKPSPEESEAEAQGGSTTGGSSEPEGEKGETGGESTADEGNGEKSEGGTAEQSKTADSSSGQGQEVDEQPSAASEEGGEAPTTTAEPADRAISADKPEAMSTLRVRTWQDAWMRVTDAGGDNLVERVVPAGKDLRLYGEPPFRAKVGNAAGVQLYFEGQPLAPLGEKAEVVTVTVDGDSETIPEAEVSPPQGGGEGGD